MTIDMPLLDLQTLEVPSEEEAAEGNHSAASKHCDGGGASFLSLLLC
ncbi:SapB/AmfS family lanthipeptide [Streptomyces sp. NPDC093586]